jgi:glycosyltransferase involved in cell wall biosynthesis
MRPIVSIIIPTHNEADYITNTLIVARTAAEKSGVPHEIIVVDNNNTDATVDLVEVWVQYYPTIRLVHESQPGLTYARERGRLEAKGDFLIYIDADTHINSKFIWGVYCTLATKRYVGGVGVPYGFYDAPDWLELGCRAFFGVWKIYSKTIRKDFLFGPAFAVRADIMRRLGGFDTNIQFYGEDANTTKRVSAITSTRFLWDCGVRTSARRYKSMGPAKLAYIYFVNYLSMMLKGKPSKHNYTEVK